MGLLGFCAKIRGDQTQCFDGLIRWCKILRFLSKRGTFWREYLDQMKDGSGESRSIRGVYHREV